MKPMIVQYWHNSPPEEVKELMETWETVADEGFEYRLFDDQAAASFIRDYFDDRTAEAYQACAVPAMKADFFRVCALLVRPGIYVDADMRRTGRGRKPFFRRDTSAPLLPLYQGLRRGILFKRENRVANGFIAIRKPQDPLLSATLATAISNIENRVSNNVYLVTGPGIASKWLKEFGPDHAFFADFAFFTEETLKPYVRMVGRLSYKLGDDHWVNAQKKYSIFNEPVL